MRRTTDQQTGTRCTRRRLLKQTGGAIVLGLSAGAASLTRAMLPSGMSSSTAVSTNAAGSSVRLFLCGDVMIGRGIDQIMNHPGDPQLHESFVKSATDYVAIAEKVSGAIPRNVGPAYIWGDALAELDRVGPDARIINVETSVTSANDPWFGKGIHYRMHPANAACLSAAKIDCCTLANNHVLDWGYDGLKETITALQAAGVRTAGAGNDAAQARAPAVIDMPSGGRVLVFAYGSPSSGIPVGWAAQSGRAGINELNESDPAAAGEVALGVRAMKRPGDLVVASIHWGSNWGYEVPGEQQRLAHALIDEAGVDVVYGHSSHHPRPIEVYGGKLILYGCGDFLNDYEGIGGHDAYRAELALMYFPELDASSGVLRRLMLVPTRIRKFRANRASVDEAEWLREMLEREGRAFGSRVNRNPDGSLELSRS